MRLVIITGGETGEREVSIQSANNIKGLLDFAEVTICTFPEEKQVFLDSVKEFDLVIPMIHGQGGEDGSLQELLNNLNIPFLFSDVGTHNIGIDKQATKEAAQSLNIISPKNSNHFPLFHKTTLWRVFCVF
jgi:D-alanine-D-alanine ligase